LGYSAWYFDGTTTRNIGLTDAAHTGNYVRNSFPNQINENGQVAGFSKRYDGTTELGQSSWLYDPLLDQTFELTLSTRSDGYAWTEISYLGQDGLVLGAYQSFDSFDNDLGQRAFYYTIDEGLHDLGFFVDGGLAANGWDWLARSLRSNSTRQILGYGKLSSQTGGQSVYLLTPGTIPEPATLALSVLTWLAVAARRLRCTKRY
jgi:hypothetical protein